MQMKLKQKIKIKMTWDKKINYNMYVPFEERGQMDKNFKRGVYFVPCIYEH